jgi:FMN reductase
MTTIDKSGAPLIVGIGGTSRAGSSTELALLMALKCAEEEGARTRIFNGSFLATLPHYVPDTVERSPGQREIIEAIRGAHGLIVATPGYHGGVSALVKNALDLLEDLHDAQPNYLDERAVGCIVTAAGWQSVGTTLSALRSIVHALRGWPTPCGAGVNTSEKPFDASGACTNESVATQLRTVGKQVARFAMRVR